MSFDRPSLATRARELAARNVFIGTSSWKYEGWIDQLYTPGRYLTRGKHSKARFEAECLSEYAELFRSVCVDAAFYTFPAPKWLAKLGSQVPDDFRFAFKVTEEITVKKFPKLLRHGDRAGKPNPHFLDASLFGAAFLEPLAVLGEKAGLLIFEFSRLYPADFARGRDFVAALDSFLAALPRTHRYAVEIRNSEFLHPEYFAMLRRHDVAHVFSSWTRMPPVSEQLPVSALAPDDPFAARFLLTPGRRYEEAVTAFSPYTETREPNPDAREAIRNLVSRQPRSPSFVFVNNRLEGNALLTIQASLNSPDGGEAA